LLYVIVKSRKNGQKLITVVVQHPLIVNYFCIGPIFSFVDLVYDSSEQLYLTFVYHFSCDICVNRKKMLLLVRSLSR
jgi:hypothetical protein